MRIIYFISFVLIQITLIAQGNCNLFPKGSDCRRACEIADHAGRYYQGARQNMELYDSAISICPTYADAYMEKSVPYLKRGDYYNWRKTIDTAIALDPKNNLGYRGACLVEFVGDYKSALQDFVRLDSLKKGHLGYNANGDYNIRILMAICYRELNQLDSALNHFNIAIDEGKKEGGVGTYDYLHRAVCKMRLNLIDSAISDLNLQIDQYKNFPDTYYYLGLCYKLKKEYPTAQTYFEKALTMYPKNHRRDPYVIMPDQIFLSDINRELKSISK